MIMIVREKRDIKSLLFKFGVAIALSCAGFLYSLLRNKRIKPSKNLPSPRSSDNGNQIDLGGRAGLKDDLRALQTTQSLCDVIEKNPEVACCLKVAGDNSTVCLSPNIRCSGDNDEYLLPEFNELVKEFDSPATHNEISWKDVGTPKLDVEPPKAFITVDKDECEQEIWHLRNTVRMLTERERSLEIQLLEYYGLKEQETAVMELQNRLKINNMEAKLFSLKIESLRADNRRLEAQVADYAKVVTELETARAKIKLLKKKLRSDAEQNKEQIISLQQRVTKLQEQEHKVAATNPDVLLKLKKLKNLEDEAEEFRKSNKRLQLENSELAQRLESTQILANSVLEDSQAEEFKELSHRLRQENEALAMKIEQLQADRCTDVEELVYLRWLNACLRYELRNYRTPPGKTVARDLSKTLSPKSEEKAKQLILEYARTEGAEDKGINIMDFDSDQWSSPQASYLTDSGEFDETSVEYSSATRTNSSRKVNFFSKLRNLIRGKASHHHNRPLSVDNVLSPNSCASPRGSSSMSTGIDAGIDGHSNRVTSPSQGSSTSSLDIHRLRNISPVDNKDLGGQMRNSDVGPSYVYTAIGLGGDEAHDMSQGNQLDQEPGSVKRSELVKYASALKIPGGRIPRSHRGSASFRSC